MQCTLSGSLHVLGAKGDHSIELTTDHYTFCVNLEYINLIYSYCETKNFTGTVLEYYVYVLFVNYKTSTMV